MFKLSSTTPLDAGQTGESASSVLVDALEPERRDTRGDAVVTRVGVDIGSRVGQIVDRRRQLVPVVEREMRAVSARSDSVKALLALLSQLRSIESDEDSTRRIDEASGDLVQVVNDLRSREETLRALRTRFSRDTVNIGVSGEARVGKSTTLQRISGLSDTQIPTGDGLPVTAVRSEIFNSTDEHADVSFRDQASFISEYIRPLLSVVNEQLDPPIEINTLHAFRGIRLPESLGNNIDSTATDSLKRLKEAQRSIDTYADLLTGGTKRVALADLRKYVAYPTNDELRAEESGGAPASRAYVAVNAVAIYCPFPSLPGAQIGLVDLPGLGEIGASVADMHLSGLEDGVDQIVPIMRPTESEGFVKQGIASNIDHLRRIQPGIKRRADLITAGINAYAGLDRTVQSLAEDFDRSINGAQESDKIELLTYTAIDDASVSEFFSTLLMKIADRLPSMDEEVLEYALRELDDDTSVLATLRDLDRTMNDLLRRMPLPDKILNQQIDRICSGLVDEYNRYEVVLATAVGAQSQWYKEFDKSVATIHQQTSQGIKDGFFLGEEAWRSTARGQADYYNWYREEAKRVRREIIARYSGLDTFYDDHVTEFKLRVIQTLLDNTGNLDGKFNLRQTDDADVRIDKIASQLGGTVPDEDLESALALLKSVRFSFRNNVFLQISKHLESLSNPPEIGRIYGENAREELGNLRDINEKIKKLSTYLAAIATEANDNIQGALLKHDDRFHEYLSVSMSFFIDHLYRKDFENFKHGVVRGLINNYRNLVLANESRVAIDGRKKNLIDRIKETSGEIQGGAGHPSNPIGQGHQTRQTYAAAGETDVRRGQQFEGMVKSSKPYGVFVDVGLYRDGLVPMRFLNGYDLKPGQVVRVEIDGVDDEGKITLRPASFGARA